MEKKRVTNTYLVHTQARAEAPIWAVGILRLHTHAQTYRGARASAYKTYPVNISDYVALLPLTNTDEAMVYKN